MSGTEAVIAPGITSSIISGISAGISSMISSGAEAPVEAIISPVEEEEAARKVWLWLSSASLHTFLIQYK